MPWLQLVGLATFQLIAGQSWCIVPPSWAPGLFPLFLTWGCWSPVATSDVLSHCSEVAVLPPYPPCGDQLITSWPVLCGHGLWYQASFFPDSGVEQTASQAICTLRSTLKPVYS